MAKARRAQFVRKFRDELAKRSAAGVTKCEIRFDRRDWQAVIETQAVKELRRFVKPVQGEIFDENMSEQEVNKAAESVLAEVIASPNWNQECDKIWDNLGRQLQKWSSSGSNVRRTTWSSIPMASALGSSIYHLDVVGTIFFDSSTRIRWVDNVIVSVRKVAKAYAKSISLNKTIVAEHGRFPEKSQAKGQQNLPGIKTSIGGEEHQRGGGQGNALQTALIKALSAGVGKATKDPIMKVWIYLVNGILDDIWDSTLDKRKSPNTITREHTIHLTILPDETQTGVVDRKIAQSIKKYFARGGPWEKAAKKHFVTKYAMKTTRLNKAMSGSEDFTDELSNATIRRIIQGVFPHKSRPDMRLKINKKFAKKIKNSKSRDKLSVKTHTKATQRKIKTALFGAKATGKRAKKSRLAGRAQGKTAASPLILRNLLNEMLPEMVASKMTSPALQFRTGRFANSTRVEMIHQGARGAMQVDYTYQKDPYQTFEPGFKQGSTMRDPRKIIKESIRELAIGILGRQPTTIRRT